MIVPDSYLDTLTEAFEDFCSGVKLVVFEEEAEKHGSWEWAASFRKDDKDFQRFVTLGLTQEHRGDRYCMAETWAEADDGRRYVRRLVSSLSLSEQDFSVRWTDLMSELSYQLERAYDVARNFEETDLVEARFQRF